MRPVDRLCRLMAHATRLWGRYVLKIAKLYNPLFVPKTNGDQCILTLRYLAKYLTQNVSAITGDIRLVSKDHV